MSKRRIPVDTFGIKGHRIWPKKATLPVGCTFISKWGRTWEVVENCGGGRYKVFADNIYVIRSSKEIKSGQIVHPCDKTVYGVGYLGIGKYTYAENKHRSDCWRAMFKRCYETNGNYLSYTDTEVCENWHNFQNFAEWYDNNYIEGFELDKDLKSDTGAKVYSPTTCCFLSPKLNKQLSQVYITKPTKEGRKYRAKISFNRVTYELGRFDCWKTAICMQVSARFSAIQSELRITFGEDFIKILWSDKRLFSMMERSINLAE